MRTFSTSVVELSQPFDGDVETHPYEAGWALEAIFFVATADGTPADTRINLRAQISADGIRWIDEGSTLGLTGVAHDFVRVAHFGGFLRLQGVVQTSAGDPAIATLTVRLALKG